MVGIGDSHSYAAIGLFHLPLLDDLIHRLQRGGVLGAQYQSAGVAVDAIAQCRRKAVFLCWVIFALLVQVFLHPSDQCIRGAALILMYHQSGGLISDKDILILIDDRKRVPGPQKGLICPLFLKKLIIEVQAYHITHGQSGAYFCPLAIHLDPFGADPPIHHRGGQQRYGFAQEFIQSLSGIILSYCKFFHL